MKSILFTIWAIAFFLFIAKRVKRKLLDVDGKPREDVKNYIVERKSFLHPNLISSYGLFLVVLSMLLYYFQFFSVAVFLYVAGAYFDMLDGQIARVSGLESSVGEELDPLFDKIKILPPLLFFAYHGCYSMWFAVTFVCLDVIGQLIRLPIHILNWKYDLKFSVASNVFGKVKTTCASFLVVYCDLQIRVDYVPDIASYGLGIVMFFGILSIVFKFKEEFTSLQSIYKLITKIKIFSKPRLNKPVQN